MNAPFAGNLAIAKEMMVVGSVGDDGPRAVERD